MVMDKKIVCPSCGAEFETDKVKCPFCGTIYYKAAEAEYMDKLEDVKFFDISLSSIRENKGNRPGDVYLLNGNDVSRIRMISSERK